MMKEASLTRRLNHLALGKKRKPFNPIAFALRRGPVILGAGTLLTLLLAALLLPGARPVYEADAVLLIDPAKEPTLTGRERDPIPGNLGDWTRTQITRITSEDVVKEAIARLSPEELPDFLRQEPGHPANLFRVIRRVKVREVPRTYLVTLGIKNDSPEGIAPLLNTIVEVYIEKLQREFEQTYTRRLSYLLEERSKIAGRLEREEARLLELAEEADSKAFLHEGYNNHLNKVDQIQRLYWEAFAREAETRSQLEKVQADARRLAEMDLKPFADERVADNFGINRIEQWTYEQLQQLRATIDGLRPENPDRVYVEERMASMNRYLEEYKSRVNDETIANLLEKQRYELDTQLQLAQSTHEAAAKTSALLLQRLEDAREEAARTSMAIFQASDPTLARNQLRSRIESLNSRIDDTEMEAKTPIRVQLDKRAATPVEAASSSAMNLVMMAVVLGFGAVGAPMLLYEFFDNRLRSAREVELALGGPGPDPISAFVSNVSEHPDFPRATLEHNEHPATRAVRDLAARLEHEHRQHGGRVYAIAGLHRRCGASSVALNLAHALHELGGSAVLVELNPAAPGLAALIRRSPPLGLESVLRGETEVEAALLHDTDRDIHLLASNGSGRPDNLRDFPEILDGLRARFEHVLVDAGCFQDELTAWMARRSDAVLLVTRHKETPYRDLRRGIDLLIQAEVPALTAVLNFASACDTPFVLRALEQTILWISRRMDSLAKTRQRLFPGKS